MVNNVLLIVAWITVMLGTLYPLVLDFMGAGKLSIGPPYFNAVFVPIMSVLAVVMGFGIVSRWKKTEAGLLFRQLRLAACLSVAVALAMPMLLVGEFHIGVFLGTLLAAWILGVTASDLFQKSNNSRGRLAGLSRISRSYYGMVLGHVGFAVAILGVALVSLESQERDVRMSPGDSVELAGYSFNFESLRPYRGANYSADRATIIISKKGELVAQLHPEKRVYFSQGNAMTEAGIDPGLFRDLYVALGEPLDNGAWAVRIQYKPFVRWIWLGALFMAFGGFCAISDKRYRLGLRSKVVKQDGAALTT